MAQPAHLAFIIARSPLMQRATSMLTINSVDAASLQCFLYDGVLDFVGALSTHEATACLIYNERPIYHEKGGSLLDVSFESKKGLAALKVGMKDTGLALVTLLGSLIEQANSVLQHAYPHANEFSDRKGQNMITLSMRLRNVSNLINQNRYRFRNEMDTSGEGITAALSNLSDWHRETCVRDLPDDVILDSFSFSSLAKDAASHFPPRGRMKRLITEVAGLRTSLPEGIFIRYGSSRLDVMKILIVGSKGTPYEYGFFEFDLFCPLNYPYAPPLMRFLTTNGGTVRFNPNLYEDGKSKLN